MRIILKSYLSSIVEWSDPQGYSYVFYRETAIKITRKKSMVKFNVFNIAGLCPEEAVFKIQLNWYKKFLCGRPGEDFFRHSHFRKQEHYFFGLKYWALLSKSVLKFQFMSTKFCLERGTLSRRLLARQSNGLTKSKVWANQNSEIYEQALEP